MDVKEAIEWLHGCIVSEEWENGRPNGNITCELTRDILNMAISALEKLEGKKPGWNCPCCHSDRISVWQDGGFVPTRFAYCPDCGQKIDWSNKQEVNEND